MSLEETIAANTAAVVALTAALNKPLWLDPKLAGSVLDIVVPPAGSPITQNIAKAAGIAAELAVDATPAAALAPEAGAIATATVSDVLTAASQLIANPAKGKAALKAAFESVGIKVKAISEVPADKLGAALGAIKEAIAA